MSIVLQERKQCHYIEQDYNNLAQSEIETRLENITHLKIYEDLHEVVPCTQHVFNDHEYGVTIVEHVSI